MVAEGYPVEVSTRVCLVSNSGFYAWRRRPSSKRASRHAWQTDLIVMIHFDSRGTYGEHRVHTELTIGRGIPVGYEPVCLLMRRADIQGLPGKRRRRRKAPSTPTASDLIERKFARSEPDRLWVTDITEHRTREGKLYCCVVLDTFSRCVVGWSIDSTQTSTLVTNALGMAISNRRPEPGCGDAELLGEGRDQRVGVHALGRRQNADEGQDRSQGHDLGTGAEEYQAEHEHELPAPTTTQMMPQVNQQHPEQTDIGRPHLRISKPRSGSPLRPLILRTRSQRFYTVPTNCAHETDSSY